MFKRKNMLFVLCVTGQVKLITLGKLICFFYVKFFSVDGRNDITDSERKPLAHKNNENVRTNIFEF